MEIKYKIFDHRSLFAYIATYFIESFLVCLLITLVFLLQIFSLRTFLMKISSLWILCQKIDCPPPKIEISYVLLLPFDSASKVTQWSPIIW